MVSIPILYPAVNNIINTYTVYIYVTYGLSNYLVYVHVCMAWGWVPDLFINI